MGGAVADHLVAAHDGLEWQGRLGAMARCAVPPEGTCRLPAAWTAWLAAVPSSCTHSLGLCHPQMTPWTTPPSKCASSTPTRLTWAAWCAAARLTPGTSSTPSGAKAPLPGAPPVSAAACRAALPWLGTQHRLCAAAVAQVALDFLRSAASYMSVPGVLLAMLSNYISVRHNEDTKALAKAAKPAATLQTTASAVAAAAVAAAHGLGI